MAFRQGRGSRKQGSLHARYIFGLEPPREGVRVLTTDIIACTNVGVFLTRDNPLLNPTREAIPLLTDIARARISSKILYLIKTQKKGSPNGAIPGVLLKTVNDERNARRSHNRDRYSLLRNRMLGSSYNDTQKKKEKKEIKTRST